MCLVQYDGAHRALERSIRDLIHPTREKMPLLKEAEKCKLPYVLCFFISLINLHVGSEQNLTH